MDRLIVPAVAVVAAATVLLAAAGTTHARILLGRGAAGIELGQSRDAVVATLGKPRSVSRTPGPGGFKRSTYDGVEVYTDEVSHVFMIVVTGHREAFANRIRKGSTLTRLRNVFPAALRCSGESGRVSSCKVTTTWRVNGVRPESSTTEFMISRSGRVERIAIYLGSS